MQTDAGFSHGLMVCSSGPQAIWCWGFFTGSYSSCPSVQSSDGGGGRRFSQDLGIYSSGSSMHFGAEGFSRSQGLQLRSQQAV